MKNKYNKLSILSIDFDLSPADNGGDCLVAWVNHVTSTPEGYTYDVEPAIRVYDVKLERQALFVRKMLKEKECDYLVTSCRGMSIAIIDFLMTELHDKETGVIYGALTCVNDAEIAKRCAASKPAKNIFVVKENASFNECRYMDLRGCLREDKIKLLAKIRLCSREANKPLEHLEDCMYLLDDFKKSKDISDDQRFLLRSLANSIYAAKELM